MFRLITLLSLFSAVILNAQPPAGAVAANPNVIYYAGGSCVFYDANNTVLLSVNAAEAGWSATPAKAAWVVVTPTSGGYYEFPNYSSNAPTCNTRNYLLPFWQSDTIYNELVLLKGVNSTANLMFKPSKILSVTNYDFSKTFVVNTDYSVNGRTLTQKSASLSSTYAIKAGVKGNGQPNGLMNVNPTSWTCVTYIPDRSNWQGNYLLTDKSQLLPKTIAKLKNKQNIVIEAYGMSITAGLNVSGFAGDNKNFVPTKPYMHSYVDLLKEGLQTKFGGNVTMINGSCGGKDVAWINQYCKAMVVPNTPDLVILDMGMNDIWGTSNDSFKARMSSCINKIKSANPNTEFILIGNMLPDVSSQGSPSNGDVLMYGFLQQLKSLETNGIAVLDMTTLSDSVYKRKGPVHCTSNSLHPNDYLARWYAHALINMFGQNQTTNSSKIYYVNTTGSNGDGLSLATAWTDLNKLNATTLLPGDQVWFEGGKTFVGNIEIDQADGNDPMRPILFKSYGNGRATIQTNSTLKCGFKATNTQGVVIDNLQFKGPGNGTVKDMDGVQFYSTLPAGYLSAIQLKNLEVSGFGFCGIRLYSSWSATVKSGFKDVVIDSCSVHDCRENGIVTFAYDDQTTNFYHHKNINVKHTKVYNITGYAAASHKGSGIVLSQLDSSLIEKCEAYNTGTANTACGGPGGIWVYAANRILIQYCESHHNSSGTSTGCDGLGFDLDGGVTNSTLQYCYAHDNDGAGILLGNFSGARPWKNNTVRYNISANDARTNNSSVTLFTAPNTTWDGLKFYNNTVYTTSSSKNTYSTFGAFQMSNYGNNMSNVECYNNIFYVNGVNANGPLFLLNVPTVFVAQKPKFINNLYWSKSGQFRYVYGNAYSSLTDFRTAGNECEKLLGINKGFETDPLLLNVDLASPTNFPRVNDSLNAYKASAASPVIDKGLNLKSTFNIDFGNRDFWNNALSFNQTIDIGAHEFANASSIESFKTTQSYNLYPNPFNDGLTIQAINEQGFNVKILDFTGKQIVFASSENNQVFLNLSHLEKGLYSVILINETSNITTTYKIIK